MTVGKLTGVVGMATVGKEYAPAGPVSLADLKLRWIARLEEKRSSWRGALKAITVGVRDSNAITMDEFVNMVANSGNCFTQEEGLRLFDAWAAGGSTISVIRITADLSAMVKMDANIFSRPGAPTCETTIVAGSGNKANRDSEDSGLTMVNAAYEPRAISQRNLTAASKTRPLPAMGAARGGGGEPALPPRPAGLARGAVSSATTSSVPGGIFAPDDESDNVLPAPGGNKSNLPSISGGIFEDHSEDKPTPLAKQNRSQTSSVPNGNIFTAASRPATVEYGYERFPRQGLNV